MSKNDITGDRLVTKTSTTAYDEGYDRIFNKKVREIIDNGHIPNGPLLVLKPTACEHDWCWGGDPGPFEFPVLTCSRCGEEKVSGNVPKPPPGYTAEELERDNPFNQWMHEK